MNGVVLTAAADAGAKEEKKKKTEQKRLSMFSLTIPQTIHTSGLFTLHTIGLLM